MNEILTVTDKKIIGIGFYPAYILHLSNFGDIKVSEKLYSKIWIGGLIQITDIDIDGEIEIKVIRYKPKLCALGDGYCHIDKEDCQECILQNEAWEYTEIDGEHYDG